MSILWKANEILPDESQPFAKDVLGRAIYADNLTRLVQATDKAFVLSVNAQWGAGKTTFLRMWRMKLKGLGHPTLFFDAWKQDFVDDPLVALIAELEDGIKEAGLSESVEIPGETLTKIKTIGAGMLRRSIPVLIRVGTAGFIDTTDMAEEISAVGKGLTEEAAAAAKERLDRYASEKKAIDKFRDNLQSLAEAVRNAEQTKPPIVIFIDELDRCRPDFAILVLERVKHLFSVPGIFFVLGMDSSQLAASIKAVYGSDFGAEGYLRRFIDLEFNLPQPDPETYTRLLFEQSGLDRVVGSAHADVIQFVFAHFSHTTKLSLRTQQQFITRLNVVLRTTTMQSESEQLAVLLMLKTYDFEAYQKFLSGVVGAKELLRILKDKSGHAFPFPRQHLEFIVSMLFSLSQISGESEELSRDLEAADRRNANQFLALVPRINPELLVALLKQNGGMGRLLSNLVQQLEFAERFRLG